MVEVVREAVTVAGTEAEVVDEVVGEDFSLFTFSHFFCKLCTIQLVALFTYYPFTYGRGSHG